MTYSLAWEPLGVVIDFTGHLSIQDMLNATVAYAQDSRFDRLRYVIEDYTQISGCCATPEDIEAVWALDFGAQRSNRFIRKAMVTTSLDIVNLAHYYQHQLGPAFPLTVCSTQAGARAWLHR